MSAIKYKDPSTNLWEEVGEIIKGKDAAYVGSSAPTDPQYTIWVDTSETGEGLVTSVNGQVGAVTVTTPTKTSDLTNDSGFITQQNSDYRIYNSVTDIGKTAGSATIANVKSSMQDYSILICNANEFASSEVPSTYGTVEIIRINSARVSIFFYSKTHISGVGDYRMFLNDAAVPAPDGIWRPLFAETGSVTLAAANWTGSGPYTQTVTVTGATVTADSKVDIQPDATAIQQMISDDVFALFIENNSGVLTAYAIGAALTVNVTVQVTVMEVL